MSEFGELARDPKYRRKFEKLLYLAAKRGDADLVAQRLSWGVDPNCCSSRGTTPLIANARGYCPNAANVQALLKAGADPGHLDAAGLTALDYARRKLAKLQARPRRRRLSPSLDENNQLQLSSAEQAEFERVRGQLPFDDPEFFRIWWQERLRFARRVFNDPEEVEKMVALLEAATGNAT
jgi:hypothetical protein